MELVEKIGLGLVELESYGFTKHKSIGKTFYEKLFDVERVDEHIMTSDVKKVLISVCRIGDYFNVLFKMHYGLDRTIELRYSHPSKIGVDKLLQRISDDIKNEGLDII